jgi:hypothetical protein
MQAMVPATAASQAPAEAIVSGQVVVVVVGLA